QHRRDTPPVPRVGNDDAEISEREVAGHAAELGPADQVVVAGGDLRVPSGTWTRRDVAHVPGGEAPSRAGEEPVREARRRQVRLGGDGERLVTLVPWPDVHGSRSWVSESNSAYADPAGVIANRVPPHVPLCSSSDAVSPAPLVPERSGRLSYPCSIMATGT